jgi:hypothetical protein
MVTGMMFDILVEEGHPKEAGSRQMIYRSPKWVNPGRAEELGCIDWFCRKSASSADSKSTGKGSRKWRRYR